MRQIKQQFEKIVLTRFVGGLWDCGAKLCLPLLIQCKLQKILYPTQRIAPATLSLEQL